MKIGSQFKLEVTVRPQSRHYGTVSVEVGNQVFLSASCAPLASEGLQALILDVVKQALYTTMPVLGTE